MDSKNLVVGAGERGWFWRIGAGTSRAVAPVMRSLVIVICVACFGCYTIGNTPKARTETHQLAIAELVFSGVLLAAGAAAMHDYDADAEAVPPDNLGGIVLISAGILTGLGGLISWSNSQ